MTLLPLKAAFLITRGSFYDNSFLVHSPGYSGLEENDFSANSFFTLNVYERKQNHDSNTEKKEFHDNQQNSVYLLESLGHHLILLVSLALLVKHRCQLYHTSHLHLALYFR